MMGSILLVSGIVLLVLAVIFKQSGSRVKTLLIASGTAAALSGGLYYILALILVGGID